MTILKALLLQALLTQAPPGNSKYSVVPVVCKADDCDGYRRSSYYDAPVRQETKDDAEPRYRAIAEAAVDAALIELCKTEDGQSKSDCVVDPEMKGWTVARAVEAMFGAAIAESGLREDVMNGRGKAKHPDDVGGEGRGPGGEACLMQIHPDIAWRFVPDMTGAERKTAAATRASRETVARSLLGGDSPSLTRCFRTGFRMLAHARSACAWEAKRWDAMEAKRGVTGTKPTDLDWAMYSMFGTGQSCRAMNHGKTTYRWVLRSRVASSIEQAKARLASKN